MFYHIIVIYDYTPVFFSLKENTTVQSIRVENCSSNAYQLLNAVEHSLADAGKYCTAGGPLHVFCISVDKLSQSKYTLLVLNNG